MSHQSLQSAAAAIDQLKRYRQPYKPEQSLTPVIRQQHAQLMHSSKNRAKIIDIWRTVAPSDLAGQSIVRSFSKGKLTIVTPNAAARYRIRQWLRQQGETQLKSLSPTTITSIVVVVRPSNQSTLRPMA